MDRLKSKRILVVEDSPYLQDINKEILKQEGFDVSCVGNGKEALVYLRGVSDKPDLIVLDIQMPDMDGYEFRRHQLADTRIADIPVVVVTGRSLDDELADMRAGKIIAKTTSLTAFIEAVHRCCA